MRIRFLFLLVLPCLWQISARADDLEFSFLKLPPGFFSDAELGELPPDGKADASALLKKRGLDLPAGSLACLEAGTGRFFLRSTRRDINHLTRLAEDAGVPDPAEYIRTVRLSAVCYAVPIASVPAGFGPYSSVRSLDQDKLAVLDRRHLLVRSGQRAASESAVRPSGETEGDGDVPPLTHKVLEAEVNVGDDGVTFDINLAYDLRTPAAAAPGHTAQFILTEQILVTEGDSMLHELGTTDEKEPRLILLHLTAELTDSLPEEKQPAVAAPPVGSGK